MQSEESDSRLTRKIERIHKIKSIMEEKERELDKIKEEFNKEEWELIQIFEEQGIKTWKDKDGRSVTLPEPSLKFNTKAGQKDSALKWLKENGYEFTVHEEVHHKTLNMHLKTRFEDGLAIPEELFSCHPVKKLRIS